MKRFIAVAAILIVGAGFIWYTLSAETEVNMEYRYVTLEQGDLESVVASTGHLGAVQQVQVGTQVSGIVNEIYVDFNDQVRMGQLLARIDTTLLVSAIAEAQAALERNQSQLAFAQVEYDRIKNLYDREFATEVELNQSRYNLDQAKSSITSAEISLERAERNLSYANIYAPINGVVVERSVDEGQTVSASTSAPQLFLIARDLSQMQILASVDESDIGLIENGQEVRFTVQAYDEASFVGTVRQVRLQSAVTENVVTYTVVVDVDNTDGRLLPGMTATVEFLIEKAEDVLKVPNAALRFRPNEMMLEQIQARSAAASDTTARRPRGGDGIRPPGPNGFGGGSGQDDVASLWYFDENDQLQVARVRTGISDGSMTEVIGENLEEGMQIIAGVTVSEQSSVIDNPFEQQQQGGGGFRRGGGF